MGYGSMFHDLYLMSTMKFGSVKDMVGWVGGVWNWNLQFGDHDLMSNLLEDFLDLMNFLVEVSPHHNSKAAFFWKESESKFFTVKSCYITMSIVSVVSDLEINLKVVFDLLWKMKIPLKVRIFGWRLLLDRLPTRSSLVARRIISNLHDMVCVLCFNAVEDDVHLF